MKSPQKIYKCKSTCRIFTRKHSSDHISVMLVLRSCWPDTCRKIELTVHLNVNKVLVNSTDMVQVTFKEHNS